MLYGLFALGAYFFTKISFHYLLEEAHIGLFLFHKFLSMVLFVFFLAINLGNVIVSYSTMYRSREVLFLFTKPVSYTNIFLIKFFDNFFYSSTTLLLIGVSIIYGYGSYFAMPFSFYLILIFFVFIPFMLIAAILGVLILLLIIKLTSILGVAPTITGLVAGYIGSIYVYFQLTNPSILVGEIMKYYPNIDKYIGQFDPYFFRGRDDWDYRGGFFLYSVIFIGFIRVVLGSH